MHMKHLLSAGYFFIILFFSKNIAFGQTRFEKLFGDDHYDYGYSVQQTTDGGFILLGLSISRTAFGYYWKLIKTDSLGVVDWEKMYGADFSVASVGEVQQTTDGGYIVFGSQGGLYTDSLVLMKVNEQGVLAWQKSYHHTSERSIGRSVEQTADGGFIISGYHGEIMSEDIFVMKVNDEGLVEWSKTFGGDGIDKSSCVRQFQDGSYLVAGETRSFGHGGYDVFILKLDIAGDTLWTKAYGSTNNEGAYALDITSDGGFILAGVGGSFQNRNVYVIRSDQHGNILWEKEFGGDEYDFGNSIEQTDDGGFIIAGQRTLVPGQSEMYLVKTNDVGDIYWERGFRKGDVNEAYSAHQTRDGGFIILGTTIFPDTVSTSFMYLVKTGGDGKLTSFQFSDNIPFKVCPNPFFQNTVIKLARPLEEDYLLTLYDALGREVYTRHGIAYQEIFLDGVVLPPAIYFFKILSGQKEIGNGKLIKL